MAIGPVDYTALADAARDVKGNVDPAVFTELLIDAAVTDYRAAEPDSELVEFTQGPAIYLFARAAGDCVDRTVLAVGQPDPPTVARDITYQRGYPLAAVIAGRPLDRGHFIAYSAGGGYGPNLFAQDRALNRGWSKDGRRYRALERAAVLDAPQSLMFVHAHYYDNTDIPASLDVGVVAGPRLQSGRFRNRYDDLFGTDDDTRLAAVLNGATDAQIGALGEETAAVLLEQHRDAVTITMGDAGLPRSGGCQDLDLVVMIDGELVVYAVKTRYLSSRAGRLTRAGNLRRPQLRRAPRSGAHRQGSQRYVTQRLDDVIDTATDSLAVQVRILAVDLQLMLAQEFAVDDGGRRRHLESAPIPCLCAAKEALARIVAHRGHL